MANRLDASGDLLRRSTSLPASDPVSATFWFRINTDRNAFGILFEILNSTATVYEVVALNSDGTTLLLATNAASTTGTNLTAGTWYHIGYTRNGANHTLYLNGVQDATLSSNVSVTVAFMIAGSDGTNYVNGDYYAFKVWSGVELTAAEIAAEMHTVRPQRFADLHLWTPMLTGSGENVRDYSGNGRDWEIVGSFADVDAPPVSWGAASMLIPHAVHQTVGVGAANATAAGLNVTAVPGVISIGVGSANATAAGYDVSSIFVQAVGAANASAAGNNVTAVPGAISVGVGNANATAAGYDVGNTFIQAVGSANATAAGNNVTAVPGGIAVGVGSANATAAGYDISTAFTQAVGSANATATGYNPTAVPGAISVGVGSANATAAGYDVTASLDGDTVVGVGSANATASGHSPTAVPGAISIGVGAANGTALGYGVTAIPGTVIVSVGSANASAVGYNPTAVPGSISRAVGLANAVAVGYAVIAGEAAQGTGTVSITDAARYAVSLSDSLVYAVTISDAAVYRVVIEDAL